MVTGFSWSASRLTSHAQRLDSVDCRDLIVLSARLPSAIRSIHAWMVSRVRSPTRAGRPSYLRTNIRN